MSDRETSDKNIPGQTRALAHSGREDSSESLAAGNGKASVEIPLPVEVDSIKSELNSLWRRLCMFALTGTSIVVDLAFVFLWFLFHHHAYKAVKWVGSVDGLTEGVGVAMKYALSISTAVVVALYIVSDLLNSVTRHWAEIRWAWNALLRRSKGTGDETGKRSG